MSHRPGFRPQARLRKRPWLDPDGTRTPGIAIQFGGKVLAHMTPDEARVIADKLHDYADDVEEQEHAVFPVLPEHVRNTERQKETP